MKDYGKRAVTAVSIAMLAGAMAIAGTACKSEEVVMTKTVGSVEPVTTETTEPPTIGEYDYVPSGSGMTDRAKTLLKQNKDITGWIKIFNTQVDYPVVKCPGEVFEDESYYGGAHYDPNSYYLDHDIDGTDFRAGSLFMDYRNDFGPIESEQSENIVIYGHNMANNTMFGSIRRYRQDYNFFEQAPFIELSSNYKDYNYVICGCIITSGNWYSDFVYWDMEELDNEDDFRFYIDNMRAKQLFDTGVDVKYGDRLLTLSTCYANEDNSRFLVIARRLRDGEVMGDLSTIERTEEYKKAHQPTEPPSTETKSAE